MRLQSFFPMCLGSGLIWRTGGAQNHDMRNQPAPSKDLKQGNHPSNHSLTYTLTHTHNAAETGPWQTVGTSWCENKLCSSPGRAEPALDSSWLQAGFGNVCKKLTPGEAGVGAGMRLTGTGEGPVMEALRLSGGVGLLAPLPALPKLMGSPSMAWQMCWRARGLLALSPPAAGLLLPP